MNIVTEQELYHYGIKGMKWGKRRYQNPDGSLTPAGKKRESRIAAKQAKKESIERGAELHRQLTDKSQIRWNEDRNNRLINKMTKKKTGPTLKPINIVKMSRVLLV